MQSWQPNFLQSEFLILTLLFEFKQIWRTYKDFHIRAVGNQVLLFNFELDTDTDHVLLSEPWSFDRYLILFTRHVEGESDSSSLPGTVNFWVQIHNLPFRLLIVEVVENIGATLGTLVGMAILPCPA